MKEIVYTLDEFKEKVDYRYPLHYDFDYIRHKNIMLHTAEIKLKVFGIRKKTELLTPNDANIICFETSKVVDPLELVSEKGNLNEVFAEKVNSAFKELEKLAKDLGATPGRWEE